MEELLVNDFKVEGLSLNKVYVQFPILPIAEEMVINNNKDSI